ncbi:NlpC/P60 family protein [Streptomyces sp. NBC_00289]|uniref:C40 family peptidase n=1 Tax=Streptomyces sp. NBC_00289 TaxID=2975703 RepID=UPI003251EA66
MSGRFLRLVCTAAVAAGTVLAPLPAAAAPGPGEPSTAAPEPGESPTTAPEPGEPSTAALLTDLQRLYREAERATEAYNASEEKLTKQRAEADRLERELSRARLSLRDSRGAAGRLVRQQYQTSTALSPYVRLLLARDPQHALDEGHVIGQLARERADTVGRLTGNERKADGLARRARKALDDRLTLAERTKKERDAVRARLADVEELLASLSAEQLAALAEFEEKGIDRAQQDLVASGALSGATADDGVGDESDGKAGGTPKPSREGDRAVRYAMRQLGKPYQWGAEGPKSYDCSGLTSQAWDHAGKSVPRTSQEQWARLKRIPLSELRPGDLVVYFPEATHVALYVGGGKVVQAPRPGARVKVSPIAANPILGAVRPDPHAAPLRHYTPPKLRNRNRNLNRNLDLTGTAHAPHSARQAP